MSAKQTSLLLDYYQLAKPGIIRGNLFTLLAGYIFAVGREVDITLLVWLSLGTIAVIAAGAVFNNIIDAERDAQMARTKSRAIPSGRISKQAAGLFALVLTGVGLSMLLLFVSPLVMFIGLSGLVAYVVLYGWAKRQGFFATLIGTLSGGASIVAGYAAGSGSIDLTAIILFAIMCAWQMTHFHSIAIFRRKEYAAAKLPIISVQKGSDITAKYVVIWAIILLIISALAHTMQPGSFSAIFSIIMTALAVAWLARMLADYKKPTVEKWARRQFGLSLIFLLSFCVVLVASGVSMSLN